MRSIRRAMVAIPAAIVATVAPLAGQALEPASDVRVLARVNGEPLYAEHVERTLGELHRGQEIQARSSFDLDQLMFRLVNDTLLAQEGRAIGLDELPEIRRKVEQRRESKARRRVYGEEIVERLDTSEEKVRAVYDDIFRFAVLQIVSRRDPAEAEQLVSRVRAAEESDAFEALAREVSQDQWSPRGGRIENALINLDRALSAFAASAEPGAVSPPLATSWGWTVARLVRREAADPALLEERRGRVLRELRRRQEVELREALAERLSASLGLEMDLAIFESIGIQRMHDGRLLPKFDAPERVVARVSGREITVEALAGKLASAWSDVRNATLAEEYKRGVLDQLIFGEMLIAEGLKRGYGETPEVRRELQAYELSQLASRYLKEVVSSVVDVTAEESRAYYESHRDEFRRPPMIHLLQITVPGRELAERVVGLAEGGADFGWLVRQHSVDDFREKGGDRGWVATNEGPAQFREELMHAGPGEVFGPKESPEGWVILKVDLVQDRGHYAFEAVSGNVRARLQDVKIFERIDMVIQRLRESAEIWIDREAVASMNIVPTAPEEESTMAGHDTVR